MCRNVFVKKQKKTPTQPLEKQQIILKHTSKKNFSPLFTVLTNTTLQALLER